MNDAIVIDLEEFDSRLGISASGLATITGALQTALEFFAPGGADKISVHLLAAQPGSLRLVFSAFLKEIRVAPIALSLSATQAAPIVWPHLAHATKGFWASLYGLGLAQQLPPSKAERLIHPPLDLTVRKQCQDFLDKLKSVYGGPIVIRAADCPSLLLQPHFPASPNTLDLFLRSDSTDAISKAIHKGSANVHGINFRTFQDAAGPVTEVKIYVHGDQRSYKAQFRRIKQALVAAGISAVELRTAKRDINA